MKIEIENTPDYAVWLQAISKRYRQSQIKAAVALNTAMLRFYFGLGADIVRMEKDQPWGSGFLKRLSIDLKMQMPEAECFSPRNLQYIRVFFKLYSPVEFVQQVVAQIIQQDAEQLGTIDSEHPVLQLFELSYPNVAKMLFAVPWSHHVVIMNKFKLNQSTALFYVQQIVKNGWSRAVLMHFIDVQLHLRQGKAVSNFAVTPPEPDSDLAQEVTKDSYCFDFVALTSKYHEKEFKDAMMARIEKFFLELGQGFMLVGREYLPEVGTKEIFADLLFFNMNLNRYIVVEVKAMEFESEHLGHLGLYVFAMNHILKKPTHEPTIGLHVCKTKDNTTVKWASESTQHPIGVSEYSLKEILSEEVSSDLPSIKEIKAGLAFVPPAKQRKETRK